MEDMQFYADAKLFYVRNLAMQILVPWDHGIVFLQISNVNNSKGSQEPPLSS